VDWVQNSKHTLFGRAGTFGNLGRDVLVAPRAFNFDLAFSRTFPFRERWRLEARAEAFNLINHTNFNAPSTALSSSTFGVINGAGDPAFCSWP
jgi:hypothetical protein